MSSERPYSRAVQRSLVAFVLVAIVLVVYAPIVLGGRTWDDARYHTEIAPPRIAAADAVLHGELPAWWEGTALGVPLLAEPSHGAAYPPAWLAATPRALDLLAIVHVLWCALGVALLARRLRASALGGVIAGVLVATSGVIASAALRGALPALAHLPWLAVAALWLARARTRPRQTRAAIWVAVLVALVGLAGQGIALVDAIVLVPLIVTFGRAGRASAPQPKLRAYVAMLVALACGLAIATLQWLPVALTAGDRVGAQLPAMSGAALLDLVVPRASAGWFPSLYLGAPVLVLAAIARPPLLVAVGAALLAISAFVLHGGELQIAVLALVAATYAARGFDRVSEWVSSKLRIAVVAVALAPTVIALPMLVPTVDRSIVDEPSAWARAAERVTVWPRRAFRPIMSFGGKLDPNDATLADKLATLAGASSAKWGTGAARSEDPGRPRTHDRVWTAASAAGGALFDRYGIALAILPASMIGAEFHELSRRGSWALVEYPASPTAAIVYEWIFARDVETALARLFPPGAAHGLSSGMVVLQGDGAQNQDEPGPAQPCKLLRWDAGAIDVECTAERAAYAVISSTADRGWTAQLDGRDVPWLVADVMRRAVVLTPGTHRIAWRYSVPGLRIAGLLAALGIAVLLALWLVYGRDTDARDSAPDPDRTDVN